MNVKDVTKIGSIIGEVIAVDLVDAIPDARDFSKVCVQVDVN